MYLKRLEMTGFKSFVDYTCLDFEAGISAIVGPNGCGKSNVVDALRWVLGEQSAKALRGSRMEDVIFNGTEQRKALSMAEVSLTIDNHDRQLACEHEEVTLTRRTYRSGESEYLLNKVSCRLRDILDLILGTGVGTNAYSFLEQGKIDLIISSRPADRRFVFEEAAGISKYKLRKEESLRKLEATEQNLLRVNDIAVEVKRQIGTLERQASKARRYQELKQELTTLEVSLGRRELREQQQNLRRLEQQWQSQWLQLKNQEAERETISGQLAGTEAELDQTEQAVAEGQDAVHRVTEEIIKAEEFVASSQLRRQDLETAILQGEAEIGELSGRRQELEAAAQRVGAAQTEKQDELSGVQARVEQAGGQLAELEAVIREQALEIQAGQNRLLSLVDSISSLRETVKSLEVRRSEQAGAIALLQAKAQEIAAQQVLAAQEKQNLELDWNGLQVAREELEARQAQLNQEKEGLEHTLKTLESMLENFSKTITQLGSRLHWIEELKNGLDGYGLGAKTILLEHNADPDRFPGVVGPVANFIRTEPNLEFAFESWLGNKLQYIVVRSRAQADEAIAYLAGENRGRATFIPAEQSGAQTAGALEAASAEPAWMALPGIVGRAGDLVQLDERFRSIVEALLGDAVLVTDLAAARQARAAGAACTLVSLNGEVDSPEGWVTGGSQDILERGLLGREREIEELTAELELLRKNYLASQQEAESLRERLAGLAASLENNRTQQHDLHIQGAKLDQSRQGLADHLEDIQRQYQLIAEENERAEARLHQYQEELTAASGRAAELESEEQRTQESLRARSLELAARRREYEDGSAGLGELKVAAAALSEQAAAMQAEAERLLQERNAADIKWEEKLQAIAREKERLADLTRQRDERSEQLARAYQERSRREEHLAAENQHRQECLARREQANQLWRRAGQELDAAREALHHLELTKKQAEFSLKSLEDYLQTEYQLSLAGETGDNEGTPQPETPGGSEGQPLDPEGSRSRIATLKEKIVSMGSVNLVAMEEYNELLQRFEFLDKQLRDLQEARENLRRLIQRINQESRSRFAETFSQVKSCFRDVFRRLFNGGDAELILVDENNLLETGIEIIARPPGKRLQNISLLSGGEKALTAIALLFAVFLIKPSPFCVFDEMDAPLDDTNTVRFGRILQEFVQKSQFIIITHNKITMEKADILYGITMQEAGVSRIISVKMKGEPQAPPIKQRAEAAAETAALN